MAFRNKPNYRFELFCAQKVQKQSNNVYISIFFVDSILKPICIFSTQALAFYNNNLKEILWSLCKVKVSCFISITTKCYNSDIKYSQCLLLNYYISMHLPSIKLIIHQRPVRAFHQLYIIGHTSQINQTFYKII